MLAPSKTLGMVMEKGESQVDMENLSHYLTIRILISPKGFSLTYFKANPGRSDNEIRVNQSLLESATLLTPSLTRYARNSELARILLHLK